MTSPDAVQVTQTVRRQYEQYPYPRRDPADERKRLVITGMDDLGAVNHYCFRGRRDFRKDFRALVAGGGTGDAVVFLAHQLRETDARIVYVDLSAASTDVARRRIEARGLGRRVEWIQGSLLDLPSMGLAPFDYVNCSGVLHHLADPDAGLAALRSVLKPDGAVGVMVYGLYGRTGVYQMQELMRQVNTDGADLLEKTERARAMLRTLPESNWFRRGASLFASDVETNDVELYDLFLHAQDRAYSVPQLYSYFEGAGLHLQEFSIDHRILYNPLHLIRDARLRDHVARLPLAKQRAIAELMSGTIIKHAAWATPHREGAIDRTDPENVPYISRFAEVVKFRESFLSATGDTWAMNVNLQGGTQVRLSMARVPAAVRFLELIDGRLTLGEIAARITDGYSPRPETSEVLRSCLRVIEIVQSHDLILLRHKSSPPLPAI